MSKNLEKIKSTLNEALKMDASDIVITTGKRPIIKVSGELIELKNLEAVTLEDIGGFLVKFKKDNAVTNREVVNTSFKMEKLGKRFRVHGYPSYSGYTISMRVIPLEIPDLEQLNLPKELDNLTKERSGLVLVTGSTGSGKSTTIASLMDRINKDKDSKDLVVTVEDPVEFIYRDVNSFFIQMEVGKDVPSFEQAVVDCLRKDPDIIVIGELQSEESIREAIKLAETDHLVIGTLHASGAPEAFDRILKYFNGNEKQQMKRQLYDITLGVVHQQLVPTESKKLLPLTELLWTKSEKVRKKIEDYKSKVDGDGEGEELTSKGIRSAMVSSQNDGCVIRLGTAVRFVKEGKMTKEEALKYTGEDEGNLNILLNK